MADLLSNSDVAMATGAYGDYFDTVKKPITIYKEPTKTIVSVSSPSLYGYRQTSNKTNVTYTPNSGIYYAMIIEGNRQENIAIPQTNQKMESDEIIFKVQEDTKDYLLDGKTEKIDYKGKSYDTVTQDKVSSFLDYTLYRFKARLVK